MGGSDDRTKSHAFPAFSSGDHARLQAFWGGGNASIELPNAGVVTVGRALDCDLRVDDESVSRCHVRVHVHAGARIELEDLGSSNGTGVSGRRLARKEKVELGPGDIVEIGAAMLVVRRPLPKEPTDAASRPSGAGVAENDERAGMGETARLLELVARSNIDVLLLGETGVGKEVAAQTIHRRSARAARPFVRLNCASLPDSLLEAELFGYEKGAFTGATHEKPGLLESADGGTVFLDEVGDMPMTTQAKLLRVIEAREVMRIGSLRPMTIDVRFLAATNRDLAAAMRAGEFREDLYHRLNGISIAIPPLRRRAWQIAELADGFLRDAGAANRRPALVLTPAARAALERHTWPGNVRELKKAIERAVVMCPGDVIDAAHILLDSASARPSSEALASAAGPADALDSASARLHSAAAPAEALAALEAQKRAVLRERVLDALKRCDGNQTKAAQLLGVSRRTFLNWLDQHDVPRPRKRP